MTEAESRTHETRASQGVTQYLQEAGRVDRSDDVLALSIC